MFGQIDVAEYAALRVGKEPDQVPMPNCRWDGIGVKVQKAISVRAYSLLERWRGEELSERRRQSDAFELTNRLQFSKRCHVFFRSLFTNIWRVVPSAR